jgi:hypothetical protein
MVGCSTGPSRPQGQRDGGGLGATDASASARSSDTPPAASGKAVFSELVHDFGEVEEGETVEHVFKVRNEGDTPLNIGKVRGS